MGLFKPKVEKMKNENDIPGLMQCLDHKDPDVRYSAFSALATSANIDSNAVARLKQMLKDPDDKVRTMAMLKFADLKDKISSDALMDVINNGSQNEKIELLHIISGCGRAVDEVIMPVLVLALVDKKELVKIEAIKAAGTIGNSHLIPNLVECLHDKLHGVRIQAAKAIYQIGGKESADHLISLLTDSNPEVQETARQFLALIDTDRARKAINDVKFLQIISGMKDRESVRRDTAAKIGAGKMREGLPLLHKACQDEFKEIRVEALKSISIFKDPSSVDPVARLLSDKYHDVRLEAVKTLGEIPSRESITALERASEDKDVHVSKEAMRAIEKLKSIVK